MIKSNIGVKLPKVALISDERYYSTIKTLISNAKISCFVSLFIIDIKGFRDPDLKVYQVLKYLQDALWRGVDVKLLIGGSRKNILIAESAQIARSVALSMGINCKWLTSRDVRGSHSKFVIIDNLVLCGSHNWSAPAFSDQIQDSILIESSALASYSRNLFEKQWLRERDK